MESIHGPATRIEVVKDNWGRLEWSVKPGKWDHARVSWETPSGNHEPATVVVVREDRSAGDHGVSDRFKTEVIYLRLTDGTLVSCERKGQLVRRTPYEGRR